MQVAEISPWLRLELEPMLSLINDQAVIHLRHKQPIFHQGDLPSAVYVVKSGRVCITSYSRTGMEQQLYIAEQGTMFGEHSTLLNTPHMTSSISIVDSSLYAVPVPTFLTRVRENPTLNQAVMRIMCRKNSMLIGRLLSQSSSDSLQRIAQVLVDMTKEYGVPSEHGTEIAIRFSHQDVANLLHTSRVTVAKSFQSLSKSGIVLRQQNRIYICDLKQLERIAMEGR